MHACVEYNEPMHVICGRPDAQGEEGRRMCGFRSERCEGAQDEIVSVVPPPPPHLHSRRRLIYMFANEDCDAPSMQGSNRNGQDEGVKRNGGNGITRVSETYFPRPNLEVLATAVNVHEDLHPNAGIFSVPTVNEANHAYLHNGLRRPAGVRSAGGKNACLVEPRPNSEVLDANVDNNATQRELQMLANNHHDPLRPPSSDENLTDVAYQPDSKPDDASSLTTASDSSSEAEFEWQEVCVSMESVQVEIEVLDMMAMRKGTGDVVHDVDQVARRLQRSQNSIISHIPSAEQILNLFLEGSVLESLC